MWLQVLDVSLLLQSLTEISPLSFFQKLSIPLSDSSSSQVFSHNPKVGYLQPSRFQFSRCLLLHQLRTPPPACSGKHWRSRALSPTSPESKLTTARCSLLTTRKLTTTTRTWSHTVTSALIVISSTHSLNLPVSFLALLPSSSRLRTRCGPSTTTAFWPRSIFGRPAFRQSRYLHLQRRSRYVCVADAHLHLFFCLLPASSVPASLFSHLPPFHHQLDVHLQPGLASSPSVV